MMATFRLLLLVLLRASATEAQRGQGTGTAGEGTAPACARGVTLEMWESLLTEKGWSSIGTGSHRPWKCSKAAVALGDVV